MTFSLQSLVNALSQPGGYFGPQSAASRGLGALLGAVISNIVNPIIGGGSGTTYYPSGQVRSGSIIPSSQAANISGQYSGTTLTPAQVPTAINQLISPGIQKIIAASLPTSALTPTVPQAGVPKSMGGAGQGLGPGGGAGIGLAGQSAPVAGISIPPVPVAVGGSSVSSAAPSGYSSGSVGISGQVAPVAGANLPPPPTSINITKPVGQFEAMVKALQRLNPQSGYIQTPLQGGVDIGQAMGNALKRIREYQTMRQ